MYAKYFSFLNIDEIIESRVLSALTYIILFDLIIFAQRLKDLFELKNFPYACFPFFQSCGAVLETFFPLQDKNFIEIFFILFVTLILSTAYFLYKRDKRNFAHSISATYFVFAFLFIFFGYVNYAFNFPNQLLFFIFTILLLGKSDRINLLRILFVEFYLLACISKLNNPAWILGYIEIPIFPKVLWPYLENLLILSQIVLPIFLLSSRKKIVFLLVLLLEIFHLYTVANVGIYFVVVTTPIILLLFIESAVEYKTPKLKQNLFLYLVFFVIFILNILRLFIPGNDFFTKEGSSLGFNMFQDTYTCKVTTIIDSKTYQESMRALYRCDPYTTFYNKKKLCDRASSVGLIQVNEDPFFRNEVINESNICNLEYKSFTKNSWIKENPIPVNRENLSGAQHLILDNYENISIFYTTLWFFVMIISLFIIFA